MHDCKKGAHLITLWACQLRQQNPSQTKLRAQKPSQSHRLKFIELP